MISFQLILLVVVYFKKFHSYSHFQHFSIYFRPLIKQNLLKNGLKLLFSFAIVPQLESLNQPFLASGTFVLTLDDHYRNIPQCN